MNALIDLLGFARHPRAAPSRAKTRGKQRASANAALSRTLRLLARPRVPGGEGCGGCRSRETNQEVKP